jgi:DNA-binding IscR family transcriptional regulator
MDEGYCGIRDVMKDVRDATLKILTETTIADMIAKEDSIKEKIASGDTDSIPAEDLKGLS